VDVDVSFEASLKASVDGLSSRLDKLASAQEAMNHIPLDVPLNGTAKTNATGTCVLSLKGPARGRQWQLRQLFVAGPVKGTVTFYSLAVTPSIGDWIGAKDSTKTRWPAPGFYSTRQFVLQGGETLWVVVTGATATTSVICNGTAEDYDLVAYKARIGL